MKTTIWKKIFRDIKVRKFQFLALVLILSLGAGMYWVLNSNSNWRKESLDYSYDILKWEDLQIDLLQGTYINQSILAQSLSQIPHFSHICAIEYRLIERYPVNLTTSNQFAIIPSALIGVNITRFRSDTNTNRPTVNDISIKEDGRYFSPDDASKNLCIVERRLSENYPISLGKKIEIITSTDVQEFEVIATATFPEFMMLHDEETIGFSSESQFTALQLPLSTFQQILNLETKINQVILRVAEKTQLDLIQTELETQLQNQGIDASLTKGEEQAAYRFLYNDLENDAELFNAISILFLIAGAFGTYIAVSRLTTSQRREIGISLALGYSPNSILGQYVFFSTSIGIFGAVGAFIFGLMIDDWQWNLTKSVLDLPYYKKNFQLNTLFEAILLSLLITLIAGFFPAWKTCRIPPVDAIRLDPSISQTRGSHSTLERLISPIWKMPLFFRISLRNIFRQRRRTVFTLFGITISLCLMTSILGIVDSFDSTFTAVEEDIGTWDLQIGSTIPQPEPLWTNQIQKIPSNSNIEHSELGIQVPIVMTHKGKVVNSLLEGINDGAILRPIYLTKGKFEQNGIIISQRNANKLELDIGDSVLVEHITLGGSYGYYIEKTEIKIIGIHSHVLSAYSFMKLDSAQTLTNATGFVNTAYFLVDKSHEQQIRKELYLYVPGVNQMISKQTVLDDSKEMFDQIKVVMYLGQLFSVILAFALIFNTININLSERKREIGTLSTIGTTPREILHSLLIENLLMASFGAFIGIAAGYLVLDQYFIKELFAENFTDMIIITQVTAFTWLFILGSVLLALLLAHGSVILFIRNLDLSAATKVRE